MLSISEELLMLSENCLQLSFFQNQSYHQLWKNDEYQLIILWIITTLVTVYGFNLQCYDFCFTLNLRIQALSKAKIQSRIFI